MRRPFFCVEYYAFGMLVDGRSWSSGEYRYGFNGMEKDDEVKGSGNSYTTHFRQYDSRLGRWYSVDPKSHKYPYSSSYSAYLNNPIIYKDSGGDTTYYFSQEGELLRITKLDEMGIKVMVSKQFTDKFCSHCSVSEEIQFNDYNLDKSKVAQMEVGDRLFKLSDNNMAWFLDYSGIDYEAFHISPGLAELWLAFNSYGAFDYNGSYFWGSFDVFSSSEADGKNELFLIDGTLYNMNDVGQYLWGLTASKIGVPEFVARLGAHGNNALLDRSGGALLDSEADQQAISSGYKKGVMFGFDKNINKEKPDFINEERIDAVNRSREN